MFEEEEPGLFSIDTDSNGLCLFAYWSRGRIHCSLHTAAVRLGLPLEQVKPKVCMLWPLVASDDDEVLALTRDAFLFRCNAQQVQGSRSLCPAVVETLDLVYGKGYGMQVKRVAENRERHTVLVYR